ncbi:hypothetical protein D3C78_601410 [compost metagenome]
MAFDEVGRLVRDVQVDAVHAQALHLMVDGPGHDVARSQFFAWVEARHEAFTIGQAQQGAFAAQGFGDQEALGLRMVEAGGMELVEFQIGNPTAGAPGHGDAIAAGTIGVAGIQVDLGGATGGKHGKARPEGVHLTTVAVQHVGAQAPRAGQAQAPLGNQVDRHSLLKQFDVGAFAGLLQQRGENGCARGIGGMDDAPVAVPAFAGQVKFEAAIVNAGVLIAGKGHALFDQPLNGFAAVLDGESHGIFVAQPAAGIESVLDMGLHGIGVVQYRGHATLGPESRAIGQVALAQYGDAQVGGKVECQAETGGTAADHQDIMLELLAHVGTLVFFGRGAAQ